MEQHPCYFFKGKHKYCAKSYTRKGKFFEFIFENLRTEEKNSLIFSLKRFFKKN